MPALHQAVPHLRRRRLGVIHLTFFTIAAAAPLAVVAGVVTTTYAVTGNTGVPLSYILIACALALFAVGYAAMSRHVANAGAFYSYLANGLGQNLGRRRCRRSTPVLQRPADRHLRAVRGLPVRFACDPQESNSALVRLGLWGDACRRPSRRSAASTSMLQSWRFFLTLEIASL